MTNILIYMFMFTWLYIIYHNNFNQNNIKAEPLHILFDTNNEKYIMINILDILDPKLIQVIFEELYKINYFNINEYIGLNYTNTNKEALLVIPYEHIKCITYNKMITGVLHKNNNNNEYNLVPFETIINPGTIKGSIIKNKIIDLNNHGSIIKEDLNELYLKNIYNYSINEMNIPIYLLLNNINEIKVIFNKYIK
jgi:hypothetical protein